MEGNKRDKSVDCIRGLAIFSVICAHCSSNLDKSNKIAEASSIVLSNIGTYGVVCFFFLSGYLFHYNNDFVGYWEKRLNRLIVPWVISASIVYFYVYIRKHQISILTWVNFVIGNGSYLYYITILLALTLLFTLFGFLRNTYSLILLTAVSVISNLILWDEFCITPYLNVFNWVGYFSLGVLAQRSNLSLKALFGNQIIKVSIVILEIGAITYVLLWQFTGSYWGIPGFIISVTGAFFLFELGIIISKFKYISFFSVTCGKESYFIYLWHMPIAGVTARLMGIGILNSFLIFRPVIILLVMYIVIRLISIFPSNRMKKGIGIQK